MGQGTPLSVKIKALIANAGPISVTDYFAICLADPEHGYYKSREPFGPAGDFVTAPDISQLFGEMLGIFMVEAWQAHGQPLPVRFAEIGPGRGTMMADQLRVIARLAPALFAGMSVHMVETSPRLRAVQAATLAGAHPDITWHESFDEIAPGCLLMAGNEFFDAVPFRQFIKTVTGFRERLVGLDAEGNLAFQAGFAGIDPALLPAGHRDQPEGTIFEIAPARSAIMQHLAERLARDGGTALFIDYGHLEPGFGDTLQAVRAHRWDPPLAHPGEADLTSHVDFQALAAAALAGGAQVDFLTTQGRFLLGLGLLERAGRLGANRDDATRQAISDAVERLAGEAPPAMGNLFKVISVSARGRG